MCVPEPTKTQQSQTAVRGGDGDADARPGQLSLLASPLAMAYASSHMLAGWLGYYGYCPAIRIHRAILLSSRPGSPSRPIASRHLAESVRPPFSPPCSVRKAARCLVGCKRWPSNCSVTRLGRDLHSRLPLLSSLLTLSPSPALLLCGNFASLPTSPLRLRRLGHQFITASKRPTSGTSQRSEARSPPITAFAHAKPLCLRIRPQAPRHPLHTHNRNRQP